MELPELRNNFLFALLLSLYPSGALKEDDSASAAGIGLKSNRADRGPLLLGHGTARRSQQGGALRKEAL